jgi:protoporphyrinogen oxidase
MTAERVPSLTVLGGGVAGLAVGYFAAKRGLPIELLEATDWLGGNCRTLSLGPFRFDTGAHRVHDRDPLVTREIQALLGDDLQRVSAPSHVYRRGRMVSFPLRPLDLVRKLGLLTTMRATIDLAAARAGLVAGDGGDFESFAVRTYGRTIAREFLLHYSAKLWGMPCSQLSPLVAGRRLKGLGLSAFLLEALGGAKAATEHLDGAFLYPRGGFGAIAERLADAVGREHIRCGARVSRLLHDGQSVRAVGVEGEPPVPCDAVVSTVALPALVHLFEPALPSEVLELAARLRFRDVALVALALDRPTVTTSATVYFPEPSICFNRVYEPRNRCPEMSPPGRTMLVAEVPGSFADDRPESELVAIVRETLVRIGWIREREVIDSAVHRLPDAYPLLEVGFEDVVEKLIRHLGRFGNLWLSGRNGRFAYTHLHDMMRLGHDLVSAYAESLPTADRPRGAAVERTGAPI